MNVEKFVDEIENTDNVSTQCQVIEKLGRETPRLLIETYEVISKRIVNRGRQWQLRSINERILEVLCLTSGIEQINATLTIISNGLIDKSLRESASMIAQSQKYSNLSKAICSFEDKDTISDFICLLTQELLIRKVDLLENQELASVLFFYTNKHELFSKIPLHLTEIEKTFGLRIHRIGVSGASTPFGLSTLNFVEVNAKPIEAQIQEEPLIVTALSDWRANSNGILIGLTGTYEREDCTAYDLIINVHNQYNAKTTNQVKIQPHRLEDVFSIIFSASANGGAYTSGELGAFGRLKTWQTLAAICGLNFSEVSCQDIIQALREYEFYEFITDSDWFFNFIFDLGVLALNRPTRKFSILVGTDVD